MSDLDLEREEFDERELADPVNEKIDKRVALLAAFLLVELTKDRIDRDLPRKADSYLDGFTEDLAGDIYLSLETNVINGMAEAMYAVTHTWTIDDARNYLDGTLPDNMLNGTMPRPNYVQQTRPALEELARKRLSGEITPGMTKEVIIQKQLQKEQTRALFEDTFSDLLKATTHTSDRLKSVIREITSEVMQRESLLYRQNEAMAKALERRLTQDAIMKRLTHDGLVGIVDSGGKRWRLDSYSRMVVNTKITEAHLQSTKLLGSHMGVDLALVSTHDAVDACNFWEGVVVSVNGQTPGYPNLDDAIATNELFHPNCRHHISLISRFSDLSEADQLRHVHKVGAVEKPELRPYRRQR